MALMSTNTSDPALARMIELDARLVQAAKDIRVLAHLDWPIEVGHEFLASWKNGSPHLPTIDYHPVDYTAQIAALQSVANECDRSDPLGDYIHRTAESYIIAAQMMQSRGTRAFAELSGQLYALPGDHIGWGNLTNLDAAEHFLAATDEFRACSFLGASEYHLSAEHVADVMRAECAAFFKQHSVDIVIDPKLPSKATAGARRINLRGGTRYSEMDVGQLLHHEAFVHTATILNGKEQPYIKSLGLGAPRTTGPQEGLATFAELITGTIDLSRLRRVALRIKAVHQAIEGANFIDVFRFFLDAGQNEQESYLSAMRVFRGGDVRGGIAFTKDVLYLEGLIIVHTFLRKAIQQGKSDFCHRFFAGRMTLGDVVALEPYFEAGIIAPPIYEPEWAKNRHCLAAHLLYAAFTDLLSLETADLSEFRRSEHV